MFKRIAIEKIISNQRRTFELHPMNKQHVKELADSYSSTGDFGVIPVREMEDGSYEQAMGHHRIAAMKLLRHTHVDCKVGEYDDNDMIRIMVGENNTQQGNVNPAKLDSINAIIGQVAYAVLLSDTPEHFCEVVGIESLGTPNTLTERGLTHAKTKIANGEPVPYVWLKAFDGEVVGDSGTVSELVNQLKDGGFLEAAYAEVQAEVEQITAAKEAEEIAAEKARKKAEKLAEEERLEAEAAHKAAREAAKRAKASEKAAAVARAADMERLAKAKAKARAEAAVKREAERLAADKAREGRIAANKAAKAAAKSSAEFEKGLHPEVLHMLTASAHQAAFRKQVQGDIGKEVFPVNQQPAIVREMLSALGDDLDTTSIKEYLKGRVELHSTALRTIAAAREEAAVKRSGRMKTEKAISEFRASYGRCALALVAIGKLLDDPELGDYAFKEITLDRQLSSNIDHMEAMFQAVRGKLNLHEAKWKSANFDELNATVVTQKKA